MADTRRELYDRFGALSPFGGNSAEDADATWQQEYDARRTLGYDDAEGRRYADEWRARHRPDSLVGAAANDWADAGRGVLGVNSAGTAAMDAARSKGFATRGQQVDLLGLIRGSRPDSVSPAAQMANDDLLRQAARAQARGVDPGLALTATSAAGRDLAQRSMGAKTAQAGRQSAALNEGAYAIRANDLSRAAVEQQTLEGDLAFQQAKEDLYLKHIAQAQRQISGAMGAELGLEKIAAGGPADFDWGEALIPGLTQMASMGLMGLASGSGGGGYKGDSDFSGPEGRSYGDALGGLGMGDNNAVNKYLAQYGW